MFVTAPFVDRDSSSEVSRALLPPFPLLVLSSPPRANNAYARTLPYRRVKKQTGPSCPHPLPSSPSGHDDRQGVYAQKSQSSLADASPLKHERGRKGQIAARGVQQAPGSVNRRLDEVKCTNIDGYYCGGTCSWYEEEDVKNDVSWSLVLFPHGSFRHTNALSPPPR